MTHGDQCLLKSSEITHSYSIRTSQPYDHLIEIMRRFIEPLGSSFRAVHSLH